MQEDIKCSQCGGNRFNELGNNSYKCLYCGSTFIHKEIESAQPSSTEKKDNVTNSTTPPNTTPMSETLRPKSYMVHSILLGVASIVFSIFWVLPFAIISFIHAIRVDNLWDRGNIDGAVHASQSARKWYSIGLRIGIVSVFIVFIIFIFLILPFSSIF